MEINYNWLSFFINHISISQATHLTLFSLNGQQLSQSERKKRNWYCNVNNSSLRPAEFFIMGTVIRDAWSELEMYDQN